MKNKFFFFVIVAAAVAIAFFAGRSTRRAASVAAGSGASPAVKPKRWHSPMNPAEIYDHPGKDSMGMDFILIEDDAPAPPPTRHWKSSMNPGEVYEHPGKDTMGMDLVPVEESPGGGRPVRVSAEARRMIGVTTATAAIRPMRRTLRAAAKLAYDETRLSRIHVKVAGTVETLYADFTGKPVRRGQPLLTIYSPDLLATQREYLAAYRAQKSLATSSLPEVRGNGDALLESARQRLRLWDISAAAISRLESSGEPTRTLTIASPVDGVIVVKNVYPGATVTPDTELLQIADLSSLWVLAEFYEADLPFLKVGQKAAITLDSQPGAEFTARIAFIQPAINPATRTVTVRLALPNPGRALVPDELARVSIPLALGDHLAIPDDAVVMSGARSVVYVEQGPDEFVLVEVKTGPQVDGWTEIKTGLKAGDVVATAANFLLDSESRLNAPAQPPAPLPAGASAADSPAHSPAGSAP